MTRTRRPHRMTTNRAKVLGLVLARPAAPFWAYGVAKTIAVEPSLVGRVLAGLEEDGLAVSWWAGADAHADGPRRHWYRLTDSAQGLSAQVDAVLRQ